MKTIYALLGASGTGKTTLGRVLGTKGITELVSHTTRSPRTGETEGVHYYFVDPHTFNHTAMIEKTMYDGHYYGLAENTIDEFLSWDSQKAYVVLDSNGVEQLKDYARANGKFKVVTILVVSPMNDNYKRMSHDRSVPYAMARLEHDSAHGIYEYQRFFELADYVLLNKDEHWDRAVEQIKFIAQVI